MRKSNRLILSLLSCTFLSAQALAATAPVSLSFPPNGQFQLPVSNTNPNLIVIPGDRITGISSAAGKLTDKRNTRDGAVLFSSTGDKPFTLFIETEHGQVVSVQATPRAGEGRSYRLLNAEPIARPAAKTWETSQPYESLLVELNKAILKNRMPAGYAPASTEYDHLSAPAGLSMRAEEAWTGNALRVVRYRVSEHERQVIEKFGDAKDQWFSSFMLRINDTSSFHRLFVDPLSRAMFSSDGKDFEFIREQRSLGVDIHDAVYALAKRKFADEMDELENWEDAA